MKKIMFLITCMSFGGAEKVLIDLVNNLDSTKYEVTVFLIYKDNIYGINNEYIKRLFNENIKLKYICNNHNKLLYRAFNIALNRVDNKILHRMFIGSKYEIEVAFSEGLPTQLLSKSSNKKSKKIAWLHTDSKNRTRNMTELEISQEKVKYGQFNKIVAVSQSVAESFKELHTCFNKVYVKYNPIDTVEIIKKSKERLEINNKDNINLIAIGRLTKVKGYERLINVIKRLEEEKIECSLKFIGEGECEEELRKKIIKYNLTNKVELLGLKTNPYKYLSGSDILVCSSFVEGLSTVVIEAITLGKPVVTTNCNGMKEIFADKECGIICENSEEGLYEGLKKILTNQVEIEYYREQCKKRAIEFDIKTRIKEIEMIF